MIDQTWADLGIDVKGRRSGRVKCKCPQCHPTRKNKNDDSLSVDVTNGYYRCHNCGWKGRLGGGSLNEHDRYGAPLRSHERLPEYKKPSPPNSPDQSLTNHVVKFFNGRGISEQTLSDSDAVTWGMEMMSQHGKDRVPAMQFLFKRDGEVINIKYRAKDKAFRMVKDAERIFYGLDWCVGAKQICITEGEIDALSLREVGISAVLSVPDGAPEPPKDADQQNDYNRKFSFLESGAHLFAECDTVIIAVDNDGPGRFLAEELSRRIGYTKCFTASWPEGCKDANDVLKQHGPQALRDCIERARPFPVEGIIMPRDLIDSLLALRGKNPFEGWLVGWGGVETLYRPAPSMVTVVTGIPSSGKSKVVDAMVMNLAETYGFRFGLCSPENWPPQLHSRQLVQYRTGKSFMDDPWSGGLSDEEIIKENDWLDDHFRYVLPERMNLDEVLRRAEILVFRDGIKGFVIDPWTSLSHTRPSHMAIQEYVAECLVKIRKFARDNDLHAWVIAHPTKMTPMEDGHGGFKSPVVDPYSIRDAAAWFDLADFILSVSRDKSNEAAPVEWHVQKVRHQGYNGELGMVKMYFDKKSYRYSEKPFTSPPQFGQKAA